MACPAINTAPESAASAQGDGFIAQLRHMTVQELALVYDALTRHMEMMHLLARRGDSYTDAFDVLHEENDWRIEAVVEEISNRQPGPEEYRDWQRTLGSYGLMVGEDPTTSRFSN